MINELLGRLIACRTPHTYTGLQLSDLPVYVAIDHYDRVALAIPAKTPLAPQHLKSNLVSLKLGVLFSLTIDGQSMESKPFHVLSCESTDPNVVETFLVLVTALSSQLHSLDDAATDLLSFFDALTILFSTTPAANLDRERQGLWGELFVLRHTQNIRAFAGFWHSEPNRKFDFSCGHRRLEVKTKVGGLRYHTFSHQQVYSPDGIDAMIASLLLTPEDSGLSLRQLIEEARSDLETSLTGRTRLERAVRRAGMVEPDQDGPRFDEHLAAVNLTWVRITDCPKFPMAEPPGVSGTRYEVDLSTVPKVAAADVRDWLSKWLE